MKKSNAEAFAATSRGLRVLGLPAGALSGEPRGNRGVRRWSPSPRVEAALLELLSSFSRNARLVGTAGVKDRRAETTQFATVNLGKAHGSAGAKKLLKAVVDGAPLDLGQGASLVAGGASTRAEA